MARALLGYSNWQLLLLHQCFTRIRGVYVSDRERIVTWRGSTQMAVNRLR